MRASPYKDALHTTTCLHPAPRRDGHLKVYASSTLTYQSALSALYSNIHPTLL